MGTPRFRSRALACALYGALAASLLVLGACGSGDDSVADPPISSSTGSSSPTTAPHRESPEHFIRRWAGAEKRMENTGELTDYLAMSNSCKACHQLANDVKRFYAAGGFVRWKGWTILSIRPGGRTHSLRVFVVKVTSGPTTYKESASGHVQHLKGGPSTHELTIRRVEGEWQVVVKAQLET